MRIVLATDGSQNAEYAARILSHLPHRNPIELTVLTTVYVPDSGSSSSEAWLPAFKKEQYETAEEHYDHIVKMFSGADVKLRHEIAEGHVGHSITETAAKLDADLIVLGAKGHSAVNRILLGSVSDFVATQAKCGVLVVRQPPNKSDERLGVLIAQDNSKESNAALEQFKEFEWGESVGGHVLSIVPIIRTFRQDLFPDMVFERAHEKQAAEMLAKEAVESIRDVAPNFEPHVVESEHVGESIVAFAEQHQCNLILVGEHRRTPIGRLMLGSVSRFVLRHAECSVWIARPKANADKA